MSGGSQKEDLLEQTIQRIISLSALEQQAPSTSAKKANYTLCAITYFPTLKKPGTRLELFLYRTWPVAISDVWPLLHSPLGVVKHQPFPEPLGSLSLADCLVCVPSKTPAQHWEGDSLNFASPKTPKQSPETLPAQQKDANLQSGLLAPYAISTQDTAKQALKGNHSHQFLTNSLTHSKLQLLPPTQHLAGHLL